MGAAAAPGFLGDGRRRAITGRAGHGRQGRFQSGVPADQLVEVLDGISTILSWANSGIPRH